MHALHRNAQISENGVSSLMVKSLREGLEPVHNRASRLWMSEMAIDVQRCFRARTASSRSSFRQFLSTFAKGEHVRTQPDAKSNFTLTKSWTNVASLLRTC